MEVEAPKQSDVEDPDIRDAYEYEGQATETRRAPGIWQRVGSATFVALISHASFSPHCSAGNKKKQASAVLPDDLAFREGCGSSFSR